MRCKPVGPTTSRIAFVGEAPGEKEDEQGKPFVGSSGYELALMLKDAKLLNASEKLVDAMHSTFYLTNVVMDRPPNNDLDLWINPRKTPRDGEILYRGKYVKPSVAADVERLHNELRALKPNVVVALGNTALWALTACRGVSKWRGSTLDSDAIPGLKVIPTYHPAAILRQYENRFITVQDLRRAKQESDWPEIRKPLYGFITNPTLSQVLGSLQALFSQADKGPLRLVMDEECKRNEVVCTGLAWSKRDAICIPFYDQEGWRWTTEEFVEITTRLNQLLRHPNVRLCNQNVSFDIQFKFWKHGVWPKAVFDTMLAQNVLFPGLTKKLDFLASMYNEYYVYWKDDGKFWDKPIIYPQLWEYNCVDCVATFEVWEEQEKALEAFGLKPQMDFQMGRLFQPVQKMMFKGVKVNEVRKKAILKETEEFIAKLHVEVEYLAGHNLVGEKGGFSPQKLAVLFYDRLKLPKQFNRKDGKSILTCDDDALKRLAKKEPLVKPLIERINMIRSYGTAVSACRSGVDGDGRWRTAYNMAGTETFRFSSSENPFGSGLNLQNLTVGKDIL